MKISLKEAKIYTPRSNNYKTVYQQAISYDIRQQKPTVHQKSHKKQQKLQRKNCTDRIKVQS